MKKQSENKILDLDYASIERRVAALTQLSVSAERAAESFLNFKESLPKCPAKQFAADMLNKPYDAVTEDERKEAKKHPIFFLKMYGAKKSISRLV